MIDGNTLAWPTPPPWFAHHFLFPVVDNNEEQFAASADLQSSSVLSKIRTDSEEFRDHSLHGRTIEICAWICVVEIDSTKIRSEGVNAFLERMD